MYKGSTFSILFMTPRMGIGGAQRYVIQKASWLKKKGLHVVVCSEEGEWVSELQNEGITHYSLSWINEDPYLIDYEELTNRLKAINDIIKAENINLIEANQLFPAVYSYHLGKIIKIPVIMNVLSELSFLNPRNKQLLIEMDRNGLYFNLGKESNKTLEKKNQIRLEKCVNLPIPIDVPKMKISRGRYLLTVARFAKEKRYIQYLMEDYVEFIIRNNINNYDFKIVGDGPLNNKYRKIANRLNKKIKRFDCKIDLLGNKVGEDLKDLYKFCDIYVGMGTTLLSAASFCKPAIIATFPPFDIKQGYGYFGFLEGNTSFGQVSDDLKKESYKKLVEKVFFNADLYENVVTKGYQLIKSEYEINVIMNKWLSIYETLKNSEIQYSNNKTIKESLRVHLLRIYMETKKIIILLLGTKK